MNVQRSIGNNLQVYKGLRFPSTHKTKRLHRYEVVVGIGGNVGDVRRRFEHLYVWFQRDKRVSLVRSSLILKNPPFGYKDQEDFFNSIIVLRTSMQPKEFLAYLMRVEKKFGRKRSFANAPRTLDLDIIFFDNRVINTQKLTIPHAHWDKRESVVIPLAGLHR